LHVQTADKNLVHKKRREQSYSKIPLFFLPENRAVLLDASFLPSPSHVPPARGGWKGGRNTNESSQASKFDGIYLYPLNFWSGFWGVGPNVPETYRMYVCV